MLRVQFQPILTLHTFLHRLVSVVLLCHTLPGPQAKPHCCMMGRMWLGTVLLEYTGTILK